jgi:tetratricopeptide (TPR) repeat protein
LRKGERDIKAGSYIEAVARLRDATHTLAYAPAKEQSKAWNLLGLAYQGATEFDDASQAFAQALKLDHNNTAVDFNLGCLRMEQGNFQGAVDYLTTYVQLQPREVNGYLKLAAARYHLALTSAGAERVRQLQNARAAFQDADKVRPTAESADGLGMIELQRRGGMDSVRNASREFQTALLRDPHYPPAILNLAIVDQYLNDVHGALQKYREYVALQPPPPHAAEVEKLAHQLDLESRIFIGSEPKQRPAPTRITPGNSSPAKSRAPSSVPPVSQATPPPVQEREVASVPAQAPAPPLTPPPKSVQPTPVPIAAPPVASPLPVTPVTPVSESVPEEKVASQPAPPPRKTLGQKLNPLHWFSGKPKPPAEPSPSPAGARYDYPRSVTYIPGNRQEAERLANEAAEARQGSRLDEAMRDYRKALTEDPTYFSAALSLGLTAIDRKDYGTALDALSHALALEENSADARYGFAWTLQQRGYYIDAARELEKLIAVHPQEVRAHLLLGNIYAEKLGELKQARDQYAIVLELDPGNAQAAALHAWIIQGAR